MGGEKAPERVLIVLHRPIPEDVQAEIRHKFADAEVNFYNSVQGVPVPVELYHKATVLVTFASLPDLKDAQKYSISPPMCQR
ncbi:unnamed protein product [Penicillium bialowiezense]